MISSKIWLAGCVLALGVAVSGAALGNPAWHTIDSTELLRVQATTPRAAELFAAAEAKLRQGDLQAAERSLAEARALDAKSWLLGRRHCQVLTELGRKAEARAACEVALTMSTAMDSRAFVGSLMSSPELSTPAELTSAVREAVAGRRLREQPFSDAALCDIAHHIGDEAMLNSCVANLEQMAPQNFETARWRSVQKQAPAWALWLGWGALGSVVSFTALHALWQWLRRPAKRKTKVAASAVVAAGMWLSLTATTRQALAQDLPQVAAPEAPIEAAPHWQLSSSFKIDHDNPEARIPSIDERNKDPLQFGYFLQDLNTEALKAEHKGDYVTAVKYWRAAAKAVPDAAVSFGKACRAYQVLGERGQAIEYCSRALNLEGATQEDYLRFAELVTATPMPLSAVEIQDLDAVIKHLRQEKGQEAPAAVVECRLGVKLEDAARLKSCTQVLSKFSPDDPRSLTFMWSYALLRKDYGEAKRLVAAMEKAGMPAPVLTQVRSATDKAAAWWRRPLTDWRYAVALGIALVAAVLGLLLLRRRLGRIDADPGVGPAPAT